MANLQSYKLLENGEDPAAEPEEELLESSVPVSKGRRRFLESLQSARTYFQYLEEQTEDFRKRLPEWLRPVCGLWPCLFVIAAMLFALVIAMVMLGAFGGYGAGEDVLQYIDPLIGTGPGGRKSVKAFDMLHGDLTFDRTCVCWSE